MPFTLTENDIDAIIEFIVFEYNTTRPDTDFFEYILTEVKSILGDEYSYDKTREIIKQSSARRMAKTILSKGLGGLIK